MSIFVNSVSPQMSISGNICCLFSGQGNKGRKIVPSGAGYTSYHRAPRFSSTPSWIRLITPRYPLSTLEGCPFSAHWTAKLEILDQTQKIWDHDMYSVWSVRDFLTVGTLFLPHIMIPGDLFFVYGPSCFMRQFLNGCPNTIYPINEY